ncbi:MAG: hypothetical protein ACI9AR_000616 [Flavobacteriaceae bacterium]|jgi:hypothetical protein
MKNYRYTNRSIAIFIVLFIGFLSLFLKNGNQVNEEFSVLKISVIIITSAGLLYVLWFIIHSFLVVKYLANDIDCFKDHTQFEIVYMSLEKNTFLANIYNRKGEYVEQRLFEVDFTLEDSKIIAMEKSCKLVKFNDKLISNKEYIEICNEK